MGDVVDFSGDYERRPRIKGAAIYAEPDPPPFAVWEVCPYLRSAPCAECPKTRDDPNYGPVHPLCYLLAEEACKVAALASRMAASSESGNADATPG